MERTFREAIVPHLSQFDSDNPLRITREATVTSDGHFLDQVTVWLEHLSNSPCSEFRWYYPRVHDGARAVGVDVDPDDRVVGVDVLDDGTSDILLIRFRPLRKGEGIRLRFRALMVGMTEHLRTPWWLSLLFRSVRFPFAFIPATAVHSYELRIQLPRGTMFAGDAGLGLERIDLEQGLLLVGRVAQPVMGALSGHVDVRFRRRSFDAVVAGAIGVCATGLVALAQSGLGGWVRAAVLACGVALLSITLAFLLRR